MFVPKHVFFVAGCSLFVFSELQTAAGQYIQAFCEGLDDVLKPYRQEIIRLEENVLIGPEVTLVYIFSRVDQYSSLFTLLTSLLNEVYENICF